jgi:putative redox protein
MANQHAEKQGLTDPSMQVRVDWSEDSAFIGKTAAGFQVTMAGPPVDGWADQGIRPMEMMLLSLGGCSSYDVVSILKKSRQAVSHCRAIVQGKRADAVPAVFTQVHLHFEVAGAGLTADKVERAVALSAEKYCSASIQLVQGGVEVTHSFVLIEELPA